MFSKVFAISALFAAVSAGVVSPLGYAAAPALGYARAYAPAAYAAPSVAYANSYAPRVTAPLARAYAPAAYAAPALGYARAAYAPAAYAAPALGYARAAYAPATYAAAPAIAKAIVPAEFDAHPQYNYAYSVSDALTGDNKHQEETRDGDVVRGSYSLVESDGTRRTVEYTADDVNGFNAVVHKEPLVQKAVVAAPAYAKVAAPLSYAAPLARAYAPAYGAPLARAYAAAPAYGYASPYASAAYLH